MRGKGFKIRFVNGKFRITPAYAGKRQKKNHPQQRSKGSPPPMRGKVPDEQLSLRDAGITPAYAGKSEEVMK